MTEWGVVGVIIALVGLFFTVGKPIFNLISAIEKLRHTCNQLIDKFDKFEANNKESQELICKGWFLPSNTYDCGSFVVN